MTPLQFALDFASQPACKLPLMIALIAACAACGWAIARQEEHAQADVKPRRRRWRLAGATRERNPQR